MDVYKLGHGAFSSVNSLSLPANLSAYNIRSDYRNRSYGRDGHEISGGFSQTTQLSAV